MSLLYNNAISSFPEIRKGRSLFKEADNSELASLYPHLL